MTVNANKIHKAIEKGDPVIYRNARIEGNLNLSAVGTRFQELHSAGRHYVEVPLVFIDCTIEGDVVAFSADMSTRSSEKTSFSKLVNFEGSTFQGEVNFREAIFNGSASFSTATFEKGANFEGAQFRDKGHFRTTQFKGEVRFQRAIFQQEVFFLQANFYENASFQNARFHDLAHLSTATFHKYAELDNLLCRAGILMNYTKFKGRSTFTNGHFYGRNDVVSAQFWDLTDMTSCMFFGPTRFTKTSFNAPVDFSNSVFAMGQPEVEETTFFKTVTAEGTQYINSNALEGLFKSSPAAEELPPAEE